MATEYFKYGDNELPARWVEPGKTIPEIFSGPKIGWTSVNNPFRWAENAQGISKEEFDKISAAAGVPKE